MKYKWNIELIMKSGEHITGACYCEKDTSMKVAEELLTGKKNNLNAISSGANSQIWFSIGEVAACIISNSASDGAGKDGEVN